MDASLQVPEKITWRTNTFYRVHNEVTLRTHSIENKFCLPHNLLRCKNSKCLKKYCECFEHGVPCSSKVSLSFSLYLAHQTSLSFHSLSCFLLVNICVHTHTHMRSASAEIARTTSLQRAKGRVLRVQRQRRLRIPKKESSFLRTLRLV